MLLIFIAGGSASGKSALTQELFKIFDSLDLSCLDLKIDDYYKNIPEGIDLDHYKQSMNFDNPAFLDFDFLKKQILDLKQGKAIYKPIFDFKIERRVDQIKIIPRKILIIEGTASLYFAENFLPDIQPNFKIFIEANPDILLKRRILRDLHERGYASKNSIIQKDEELVRPAFYKFVLPTKSYADLVITNNEDYDFRFLPNIFASFAKEIVEKLRAKQKL